MRHGFTFLLSSLLLVLFLAPACHGAGGPGATGTVVVGVTSGLRVGVDITSLHVVMHAGGAVGRRRPRGPPRGRRHPQPARRDARGGGGRPRPGPAAPPPPPAPAPRRAPLLRPPRRPLRRRCPRRLRPREQHPPAPDPPRRH